jgi:hypothetical protein
MANNPTGKLLAQQKCTTSAVSMLSPAVKENIEIESIVLSNTGSSKRRVTMYHDETGTTYDSTTTILPGVLVPGNVMDPRKVKIYMNNPSGNLAIKQDAGDDINISVYGLSKT